MTTDDLVRTTDGDYICPYCGSYDVYYDEYSEEWECPVCLDCLDD